MCEGFGNVCDGGLACFDEYEFIVHGTIWLGQLVEHLVHEIVEEKFGGLVKCSTERYCMTRVQFGQASYTVWIIGRLDKFIEFDIIFVEL